jgi:transcription elongation GreA/GreB family factor
MSTFSVQTGHQRFFQDFSGGDRRQLYAHDPFADSDSKLIFIDEGQADEFRREGLVPARLECPMPGCPCPVFKTARGGSKRDHFVHEFDPEIDHHGPEAATIYAREIIAEWLRLQASQVEIRSHSIGATAAAVQGVLGPGDSVTCLFLADEPEEGLAGLAERFEEIGGGIVWFFWNRRPLLEVGRGGRIENRPVLPGRTARSVGARDPVAWLSPDTRLVGIPRRWHPNTGHLELSVAPFFETSLETAIRAPRLARPNRGGAAMGTVTGADRLAAACERRSIQVLVVASDCRDVVEELADLCGAVQIVWASPTEDALTQLPQGSVLAAVDEAGRAALGRWQESGSITADLILSLASTPEDAQTLAAFLAARLQANPRDRDKKVHREAPRIAGRPQVVSRAADPSLESASAPLLRAGLGCMVRLVRADGAETREYTLVPAGSASPPEGRISPESPVGRALAGKRLGDVVQLRSGPGASEWTITYLRAAELDTT